MYAIIEESGGQRKVTEGEVITVDLIEGGEGAVGKTMTFDKVLMLGDAESDKGATIGAPYVAGASVTGEIVEPLVKGEKITIIKYRPKKQMRRKMGHRQKYTTVKITAITA